MKNPTDRVTSSSPVGAKNLLSRLKSPEDPYALKGDIIKYYNWTNNNNNNNKGTVCLRVGQPWSLGACDFNINLTTTKTIFNFITST